MNKTLVSLILLISTVCSVNSYAQPNNSNLQLTQKDMDAYSQLSEQNKKQVILNYSKTNDFNKFGFNNTAEALAFCFAVNKSKLSQYADTAPNPNGNMMEMDLYVTEMDSQLCALHLGLLLQYEVINKQSFVDLIKKYMTEYRLATENIQQDNGQKLGRMVKAAKEVSKIDNEAYARYIKQGTKK